MEHIDSLLQNIWNEFEEAFYIYRVKAKDSYAAITAYGEILNKYATQNTLDDALKKDVKSLTSTYISDATRMSISPQDSQDAKRGKIDLARIDFEEALKSAESPLARAVALEFKSVFETQYGNKEQAKKDADQALELYTEMGHLEKMARALSLRCAANAKKGDTQSIKQAYTDMEETLRLTDSILTEGNNTEGGNYTSHGGWTYSLRKILVHRINALQGGGDAMIVEGLHENALDKYQKAIDTLKLMGNIPHEEEDKGALAVAHLRKAHALSLIMDHEKEEECYNCYMIYVQGLNKGLVQPAAADVLKPCRDVVESYLTSRNLLSPHYPYPITPGTGFWG